LQDLDRLDEALASCDRAIELRPTYAEAWSNRGIILLALGRLAESIASFETALSFDGASPTVRFNLGCARLYSGDYAQGLADYECRWHRERPEKPLIRGPWPLWQGEPLDGKTIVVHFEQGLGDALQFVRYLPPLAERSGT
jgi:tetratricopeptide (TPR) repeat protein